MSEYEDFQEDWHDHLECEDDDLHDEEMLDDEPYMDAVEADADALASAGWGTDEDYGYYGGEE